MLCISCAFYLDELLTSILNLKYYISKPKIIFILVHGTSSNPENTRQDIYDANFSLSLFLPNKLKILLTEVICILNNMSFHV